MGRSMCLGAFQMRGWVWCVILLNNNSRGGSLVVLQHNSIKVFYL